MQWFTLLTIILFSVTNLGAIEWIYFSYEGNSNYEMSETSSYLIDPNMMALQQVKWRELSVLEDPVRCIGYQCTIQNYSETPTKTWVHSATHRHSNLVCVLDITLLRVMYITVHVTQNAEYQHHVWDAQLVHILLSTMHASSIPKSVTYDSTKDVRTVIAIFMS